MNTRKRLRDHQLVPSVEHPGTLRNHIERDHFNAAVPREQDRSRFGNETWSTRTVDGEGNLVSRFQRTLHSAHCTESTPRAGATNGNESKVLDDPRNIFTVEAAAGHYGDVHVAEDVGCRKNAAVPETVDAGAGARFSFGSCFTGE